MTNISWRHHYLPEFYLKKFTLDNNKFYIYLPQEKRYSRNGALFSPKQSFYEKDGNTLIVNNENLDFVETDFYSKIDSKIALIFNKIEQCKNGNLELTGADYGYLELFMAHLFWRNPVSDKFIIELLKIKGLKGFGFVFKDEKTNEKIENSDAEKLMNQNPTIYKMVKHFVPLFLYENILQNNSSLKIIQFKTGNKPSLISDYPIIFRNDQGIDVYKDDFILPIYTNKILIRGNNFKEQYINQAIIKIDCLLMKQANKYIATTDKNYIPMLEEIGKDESIANLKAEIFNHFIE